MEKMHGSLGVWCSKIRLFRAIASKFVTLSAKRRSESAGPLKLTNGVKPQFISHAPTVVVAVCFDALYHEIFNELDAGPVFAELKR